MTHAASFSDVIQGLKWLEYAIEPRENGLWRVQGIDGELPIGGTATPDEVKNFFRAVHSMEGELSFLAMISCHHFFIEYWKNRAQEYEEKHSR